MPARRPSRDRSQPPTALWLLRRALPGRASRGRRPLPRCQLPLPDEFVLEDAIVVDQIGRELVAFDLGG